MPRKLRFVIRDDDLNYFSKPSDITRWYDGIFAQGIPVGFAAIPFVKPSSDVYPFLPPTAGVTRPPAGAEDNEYPVSGNTELVAYVKDNALIEVLQHGCNHDKKGGVFEYAHTSGLLDDTRRGREELERAFGTTVGIFVPPHDWIGTHGVRTVEAAGMDVIRGRGAGLRNWIARWQYGLIFIEMLCFRLLHALRRTIPAYPYVLDFGAHKELCTYRLEDADVFEGLAYAHRKKGIFAVVAHVHTLDDGKKARLEQLIAQARDLDAQFVRPSELFTTYA